MARWSARRLGRGRRGRPVLRVLRGRWVQQAPQVPSVRLALPVPRDLRVPPARKDRQVRPVQLAPRARPAHRAPRVLRDHRVSPVHKVRSGRRAPRGPPMLGRGLATAGPVPAPTSSAQSTTRRSRFAATTSAWRSSKCAPSAGRGAWMPRMCCSAAATTASPPAHTAQPSPAVGPRAIPGSACGRTSSPQPTGRSAAAWATRPARSWVQPSAAACATRPASTKARSVAGPTIGRRGRTAR